MLKQLLRSAFIAAFVTGFIPVSASAEDLYHRLLVAPQGQVVNYAVAFNDNQWRVGSLDGPIATAAQVQGALGALDGLAIGGVCSEIATEFSSQGCGFTLTNPNFAGLASDTFEAPSFENGWIRKDNGAPTGGFWSAAGGSPGGSIGVVSDASFSSLLHFLSLEAPDRYLGDMSAAYDGRLFFRFGAGNGGLTDFDDGAVILRAVPEPGTYAMLLAGLILLGAGARRRMAR